MVLLTQTGPVIQSVLPEAAKFFPLFGVVQDSAAVVVALAYMTFYLILGMSDNKPMLGVLGAAMIGGLLYWSQYFIAVWTPPAAAPWATPLRVALLWHVFGWIVQFYGHGVHEKRAPALLDNLFQAIFTAPIFVLIELLLKVGMYSGFYDQVKDHVEASIAKFKAGQAKKSK